MLKRKGPLNCEAKKATRRLSRARGEKESSGADTLSTGGGGTCLLPQRSLKPFACLAWLAVANVLSLELN